MLCIMYVRTFIDDIITIIIIHLLIIIKHVLNNIYIDLNGSALIFTYMIIIDRINFAKVMYLPTYASVCTYIKNINRYTLVNSAL